MKRLTCCIFAFILSIMTIVLGFCVPKNTNNVASATTTSGFIESQITNKADLISVETNNFAGAVATKNNAPLNKDTKQMMDGYIITPSTNAAGEQRITVSINKFTATEGKSVFMWIYFEEVILYDLTISFVTSGNETISWVYNSGQLNNMVDDNGKVAVAYGWRLFEFALEDAEPSEGLVDKVYGTEFSFMKFSYAASVEVPDVSNPKGLSFYHVYVADAYKGSGIIYYQSFSNFQVKEEFLQLLEGYFVNDNFKLNGIYDVFEYVIIGKYDLKNYAKLEDFTWSIVMQDSDSNETVIKFGETYTFQKSGWYSVNVKLTKVDGLSDEVVLNTSYTIYCEKFGMGSFLNANYFFDEKTENVIVFEIVEQFVLDGEIYVYTADKSLAEVTNYKVEDGVCYITIKTYSDGISTLTLEAEGHREGTDEVETFTYTVNMFIDADSSNSASLTFLWVIFGVFCTGLVTFLVISFVKSRKFGVK